MTSFTTSFRKSAAELLRRPGSYAILPGLYDHHRDGLPRWTVERITELKMMIENAVVVDESKINTDAVNFGTRVTIVDMDDEDEEQEVYTIVGTSESDPVNGKLSNESPVGAALIGAHVGDVVTAVTPGGVRRLRVVDIAI